MPPFESNPRLVSYSVVQYTGVNLIPSQLVAMDMRLKYVAEPMN